jgi:hypothetical protein
VSSQPPGPEYTWQPTPGNYKSAPTYGQPPRRSRAGLIIALIVVFALVAVGAIGVLAYRLVNDYRTSDPGPGSAAAAPSTTSPTPARGPSSRPTSGRPTSARPTAVRPTAVRPSTVRPTTARPTTAPPATGPAAVTNLARRFTTQLNANNPTAAAALSCESSRPIIPTLMRTLLTPPTNLTPGEPIGQSPTYVIPLTGTTKGTPVTGVLVIRQLAPEPLCIGAFQVTPH